MIFSLYFPILLSLSLSFLLHAFKKHIHSFFGLATTFTTTNIATDNNLKRHHPVSSTSTTRVLDSATKPSPVSLPLPSIDDRLMMACTTESLGFESIDERRVDDDQIDENIDGDGDDNKNDEYEDDCWRRTSFPPPLSSLNGNGQPSFILLPERKNGRLQLSKARINRPEILYATRQDGRLRLYLVPALDDDDVEEQEECEEVAEEEEQEPVEDVAEEEETIVESESEEEVVEETRYEEEEEDRVREWKKIPNERFKRCHEVMNHILCHHVHGSHHNLHMYGVGIA